MIDVATRLGQISCLIATIETKTEEVEMKHKTLVGLIAGSLSLLAGGWLFSAGHPYRTSIGACPGSGQGKYH